MMLSYRTPGPTINAPGIVEPQVGPYYLLCLLPASAPSSFAAVTAPFDNDQAIFLLDRKRWTDGTHYYKDDKEVAFQEQNEKNAVLWNLINDRGEITRDGAEFLRKKYAAEIVAVPSKDAVIPLKWKKQTSADGWDSNIPDNGSDAGGKKGNMLDGSATKP